MDLYAKGQLSFLILNCLLERDFYGLDFISEIYKKSNGRIELKKPSVYSNLNRMERQGYVSSYLKNSDLGPNRKYYSITEKGRIFYQDLNDYFQRNNIDVFRDFSENGIKTEIKIVDTNANNMAMFDKNISLSDINDSSKEFSVDNSDENNVKTDDESDSDDYFDFSGVDEENSNSFNATTLSQTEESKHKAIFEDKVNTNTYSIKSLFTSTDINSNQKDEFVDKVNEIDNRIIENSDNNYKVEENIDLPQNSPMKEMQDVKEEHNKDDGVLLSKKDVEEYNRRLYDISKDINKYKRKKSFAEDQIAIMVDNPTPISESNARTKSNIEEFKNSILENKGKYGSQNSSYDYTKQMSYRFNRETQSFQDVTANKPKNEAETSVKDDGKFITSRLDSTQVEHARKIEPPRLKLVGEASRERDNFKMPPPKRDTSIDPSHKEILSRLYSKTKNSASEEIREDALYDYSDLKEFYKDQNISFNVYKKPAEKTEHNTNKLYLIVSLICFFTASVASAVLYAIFANTSNLNANTNFLYILLPALLIVDICVKFYNYKKYQGWMPNPMLQQWKMWLITLIAIALVVGINFICGLSPARFAEFATTTILPILMILVLFPFRYYLKRFLLIKYWK